MLNFDIFKQIGAVPSIISELRAELIGMQYRYACEIAHVNRDMVLHGIHQRGTVEDYETIYKKLTEKAYIRDIHEVLSENEIKLLGPNSYIETDYSKWYTEVT